MKDPVCHWALWILPSYMPIISETITNTAFMAEVPNPKPELLLLLKKKKKSEI